MEDAVSAHLFSNLLREGRAQEPDEEQQPDEETPKEQNLEKRGRHSGLTTQRPGPREAWIATGTRWPGLLQRVRPRHLHNSNLHFLQPPDCNHADQMNNDEQYAVPIAEQVPARSKGKIPAVLSDEI